MDDERPVLDHRPHAWTVGDLRAALTGVDDDRPVVVMVADSPGSGFASGYVMVSAEPVDVGTPGARLVVGCDYPVGNYVSSRTGTITVHYPEPTTAEEEQTVAGLDEKVEAALTDAGYEGPRVMDRARPGLAVWRVWSEGTSVEGPIQAAHRAIDAVNPGQWTVETSTA